MTLDFDSGLLLVGMAQGAFLSASLLLRKQGPKLANGMLGALILALTLGLVTHFMTVTQSWSQWPRLYIILSTSIMLFGPLLFAYIKLLTRQQQTLAYKNALHLLPWAALLALFTPLLLMSQAQLLQTLSNSAEQAGPNFGLPFIKLLHLTLYTLASARVLYQHQARVNQEYSCHDKVSLTWLRLLVAGFLVMEVSALLLVVMEPYFQLLDKLDSWISLVVIVLIFFTGYQGLNQPQVFLGLDKPPSAPTSTKESPIPSTQQTELAHRLAALMSQQQVFKDRFLSLQTLSEQAKVSRHTLSQYLNEVEGCHFYDFVNRHRVEEAKKQLLHTPSSVLDIALETGFNNKATFNTAFRKHTGMTPSQYRQQQ